MLCSITYAGLHVCSSKAHLRKFVLKSEEIVRSNFTNNTLGNHFWFWCCKQLMTDNKCTHYKLCELQGEPLQSEVFESIWMVKVFIPFSPPPRIIIINNIIGCVEYINIATIYLPAKLSLHVILINIYLVKQTYLWLHRCTAVWASKVHTAPYSYILRPDLMEICHPIKTIQIQNNQTTCRAMWQRKV